MIHLKPKCPIGFSFLLWICRRAPEYPSVPNTEVWAVCFASELFWEVLQNFNIMLSQTQELRLSNAYLYMQDSGGLPLGPEGRGECQGCKCAPLDELLKQVALLQEELTGQHSIWESEWEIDKSYYVWATNLP